MSEGNYLQAYILYEKSVKVVKTLGYITSITNLMVLRPGQTLVLILLSISAIVKPSTNNYVFFVVFCLKIEIMNSLSRIVQYHCFCLFCQMEVFIS